MSPLKEPGYFSSKEPKIAKRRPFVYENETRWRTYKNDLKSYLSLFAGAADERLLGESSTEYSMLPYKQCVAEKIHNFNQASRIVYCMREPASRAISHYWWDVRHRAEKRGMREALLKDDYYLNISDYAMQLKPYLELFGAEQVYWLTAEQLGDRPLEVVAKLFQWLRVDGELRHHDKVVRENVTPQLVQRIRSPWIHSLRFSYSWDIAGRFVPPAVKRLLRGIVYEPVPRDDTLSDEVFRELRVIFQDRIAALEKLLRVSFPEWHLNAK